jgi:predicted acyltransferase
MDGAPGTRERIDALDATRGCAILLMILVNFVAQYAVIPGWTKHAVGDGFTYVDAIAPAFVFVMGLSAGLSFDRRREAGGLGRTVLHALVRYGVLFLFGSLGTAVVYAAFGFIEWNIFQTLAVAGLAGFLFLFIRPPALRAPVALLLMAGYQAALSLALSGSVFGAADSDIFPSLVQSLALATIFIYGSGLSGGARRGRIAAAAGATAGLSLGAAFLLMHWLPPNRGMGSVTYLLLGLGFAAACLLLFRGAEQLLGLKRIPLLSTLGRNSLVIFMLAAVLTKALNALLTEGAGLLPILATAAGLEAVCLVTAVILDRRGIYIKL